MGPWFLEGVAICDLRALVVSRAVMVGREISVHSALQNHSARVPLSLGVCCVGGESAHTYAMSVGYDDKRFHVRCENRGEIYSKRQSLCGLVPTEYSYW